MNSDQEVEKLQKRIRELEEALERMEEENKRLKKVEKEFEEFKAKNSKTVSELRKALKIKADQPKTAKQPGLKKGHKGYYRKILERVDFIKPLIPKRCPHCHGKLEGQTQEVRNRYVTDIRIVTKPVTTKYRIHRKYCRNCRKLVEPEVPNALPRARFGLNLMLLVMYLKIGLRLSCEKIVDFLSTSYGVRISEAEVIGILRQLAAAFGDYYAYLEKLVRLARVKHSDTTGWRVNGRNWYAWVFITAGVVVYKIRKRNNHKVGLAFLGKQLGKVLTVDRYSAMRKLAEKAGFVLQFCWSHILDDSKGLARDFGAEGRYVHCRLKEIYALAKGLDHKGTAEMVGQLKGMVFELTLRHYRHSTVWKFVNNLYFRDGDCLFRFVTDPEVSATNNVSERELRALVLMRKVSFGSRSCRGAAATAMLLSVVQTLRFRKENVLLGLHSILKNPSEW